MSNSGNTFIGIMVLVTIVLVVIATFSLGCAEDLSDDGAGLNNTEGNSSNEYIYDDAVVEEVEILILESFPVQIKAVATGYLPDGCTEIDEANTTIERKGNTFDINLRTIRPKDAMCTEAIEPFEQTIDLDVYGLEKGVYTVNINGIEETFELTTDNIISE
ncbi:hypothetical protein V7O62_00170 [Methanolobus sp. ZRKC2]|uniref:hypothetical protein n=1 Tax=Methanolobus sp. ZRKC2 TaxID=3125783 RepID=UPI003245EC56